MGAGPVPIPQEVAEANKLVISHLGEPMNTIVAGLQSMSQYLFQTTTTKIFGVSGPSSACMEMAVTSLLYPGRKVLVLNLGTFSNRFAELARGVGADVVELHPQPLSPFRTSDVKAALEKEKFDVLTIVQGETSCGIRNVELEQIVKLAKSMGVRTIVDTVCTLSTMPLLMDDWGIDICVTGGQKGLSSVAGVSLIAFSEDAYAFVEKREVRMPHWCLDPRRAFKFWCKHEYHYTAPVNGVNALYEALRLICEETLEKRHERHEQSSKLLQRSLEKMGLTLFAPDECRLNSVIAINNPESVNAKELIAYLKQTYNVEISGAFGLNIVRIGQMGEQCRPQNVKRVLEALGKSYVHFGVALDLSVLESL
ncbi:Serine-pyruvate aminotransferase [Bdellovibrio bacteriovorus W]|nr:Serine-pyruvate aminotransferase [Bdellovibrio bacteriovorus W]